MFGVTNYEESGAGKSIIMLHGWPLDHRHMFHDMEPLFRNRSGWRRIYPDLPGMGKTGAVDWVTHQDQVLEILMKFIDTVAPGERFTVAGMSYGGYLARGLVHRWGSRIDGVFLLLHYDYTLYFRNKWVSKYRLAGIHPWLVFYTLKTTFTVC